MEQKSSSVSFDYGNTRINSTSLGDDSASWARVAGIESRSDSASRMGELGESCNDEFGLDEWKNNSESLMEIVVDSTSHDAKPPTYSG